MAVRRRCAWPSRGPRDGTEAHGGRALVVGGRPRRSISGRPRPAPRLRRPRARPCGTPRDARAGPHGRGDRGQAGQVAQADRRRRPAKAYVDECGLERLNQRIAVLEQRIPRSRPDHGLKELLANRAAVLYRGGGAPRPHRPRQIGSTGDLIAGARIAPRRRSAGGTDAQMDELDQNRQQPRPTAMR